MTTTGWPRVATVTGPTIEPVTVAEMRAQLRIDLTDDDDLIHTYIAAAREMVETIARRALLTQTLKLTLTRWPAGNTIRVPRPPLQSVTSITYVDSASVTQTLASTEYVVDTAADPGLIELGYNKSWPTAILRPGYSIAVTYVAGWAGLAQVPARYVQAVRLLAAHYYEQREAVVIAQGVSIMELPYGVQRLLAADRGGWF